MTPMVTIELDQADRSQRVICEQVTVTGLVRTLNGTTSVYSSYDAAQPVSVPQAILDEAVLLETDPLDSAHFFAGLLPTWKKPRLDLRRRFLMCPPT